jgi:hypothetical protein
VASARAMIERRRSSRVPLRIPVQLSVKENHGEQFRTDGEVIAVSRCGALIRAIFPPSIGTRVEVLHSLSKETREFRVIRVTNAKEPGFFHLGLEILYPAQNFWGIPFPDEQSIS